MDISDLLKMLAGGGDATSAIAAPSDGGSAPAPAPAAPPAAGGVSAFLGGDADPGAQDQATANPYATGPAPQPAPPAPPPGPSTPPSDAGSGGLSGFLSRMVEKATTRNPDTGMSFVDKLGQFGGSITDAAGETRGAEQQAKTEAAARVAATQAEQKRQQLQQMADALGMSPREKMIFTANPDAWVQANAKGLEPANLPGGDTRIMGAGGGGGTITAPKIGMENGEGYVAGVNGLTDTGGLKPSPQQAIQDDMKKAQQQAVDYYHRMMAQAAQERAHADTTRANKPALGNGGSWLPQGAKVVGVGRP